MSVAFVKADQIRQKATEMELAGVDFLDSRGRMGARGKRVKRIRLHFVDGERMLVTPREFAKLGNFEFRLRPALEH